MTENERAVRQFILAKANTFADHPAEDIDPQERDYLAGLSADLEAGPDSLPVLDAQLGRFLVYELQEYLHFNYREDEADALYDRFVGEEEDDYRELHVPLKRTPEEG
ncbi:hypothetical protein BH24DEI1_BH24DEI1_15910 [soil metagenome]|jgi:hypothetical protein|nr:hypothetical protein [Deinococcota bacterium]